jgi:hypothetical protein
MNKEVIPMLSLLRHVLKESKGIYHKFRYAYHFALYRDCLDIKMKEQFYLKLKYHENQIERTKCAS